MDEKSFIATQLRDLTFESVVFVPFEITLLNGKIVQVGNFYEITLLSGGVLYHDHDGTQLIFPYDKILSLQTIFNV